MDRDLKLVMLDTNYCDYLRKYDDKVPYNMGTKDLRPFVGILFNVDGCLYFAPLSSPKPKHLKLKDNIDFLRLDEGQLGAVNFNNMLPVYEKNIKYIDLDYETNDIRDKKYKILLKKQLFWLNRHSNRLFRMSKFLYDGYVMGNLKENIINRCCNFPLLEKKCKEYNK